MRKLFTIFTILLFTVSFISAQDMSVNPNQYNKGFSKETVRNAAKTHPITIRGTAAKWADDMNGVNDEAGLAARGWVFADVDGPGTTTIFQGNPAVFTAYEGPDDGYVAENYNGAYNGGFYIDQWLISPLISVVDGDALTFWQKSVDGSTWADPLEIYWSTTAGTTPADFDVLADAFNASITGWQQWAGFVPAGFTGDIRFAVRYITQNGGPAGSESNYFGLDLFELGAGGCIVSPASNPSPADGAGGVDPAAVTLSWTNDANAAWVDLWFDDGSGWQVLSTGTVIDNYMLPPLAAGTTYYWAVDEYIDANCFAIGPDWSFSTPQDMGDCVFFDDFEDGALINWLVDGAPYVPPGNMCQWFLDDGTVQGASLPPSSYGLYAIGSSDACGTGNYTDMTLATPLDFSQATAAMLYFDYDFEKYASDIDFGEAWVSVDGGTTWDIVAHYDADLPAMQAAIDISSFVVGYSSVLINFHYEASSWDWYFAVDNVCVTGGVIPVELTNFAANVVNDEVNLTWSTATETNNKGFSVERSADNVSFAEVAFVDGNGTTTEKSEYSYNDKVASGTYYYRLKQVDFDGTFDYSNSVEATVELPEVYALGQNYPNPFNPSTTIKFSIPVDAKVTVKLFNMLGQEVAELLNGQMAVGQHEINFNAVDFTSGVYFYAITAQGNDGTNFTATKKMMLMK